MPEILNHGAGKASSQSVLVVDDEEVVRNFMTRVLAEAGYRVLSAANGREALTVLGHAGIDLVVTDIMMPEMGGIELGIRISQFPLAPPVIYASASDHPPGGMGGRYLQKPFRAAALIRMAGEVLSRSHHS